MRQLLALAAAAAVTIAGAATASADPFNGNTFALGLSCSDGHVYTVTVLQTAADKAAVHVVDGTSVLVPTSFAFHTVVTADETGTVLEKTSTPPSAVHGRSGEHLDTFTCTFSQFAHHVWPDVGPVTIEVQGTVEAFMP
jgi:hypothetical protein